MDVSEAEIKTLRHLALPENQTKKFDFFLLLQELNVPAEIHQAVLNSLFHHRFIFGESTIGSPTINITSEGLQLVEQKEVIFFKKNKRPLNPINTTSMDIEQTCERLFQMHKNPRYQVIWTKSTYNNEPENLDVAKEKLIAERIIYSKERWDETYLNTDLLNVESYKEARVIIIKRNKDERNATIYNVNQAGAVGPNSTANNNVLNQVNYTLPPDTNYELLQSELLELIQELNSRATSSEHFIAMGNVAKAEVATKSKNGGAVLTALKAAGIWALGIAKETGKDKIVDLVNKYIGDLF